MSARISRTLAASIFVAIAAMIGAFSFQPTGALETNTLGIAPVGEPDNFHINVVPGESTERDAVITNLTDQPRHVLVYAVDATQTAQGGFALAKKDDPKTGAGAWAHVGSNDLVLPPQSKTPLHFSLSVPKDATPGDYAGGIVIEADPQGAPQNVGSNFAIQMNLIERVGVRLYVTVPGQVVRNIKVGNLSWTHTNNGIRFSIPVTNSGNIRMQPHVALAMHGFHLPDHLDTSKIETLLPGSTVNVTALWRDPPLVANGDATADVTTEGAAPAHRSTNVRLVPLPLVLGILAGLAILIFLVWRFTKFLSQARKAMRMAAAGPPPSDEPPR